MDVSKIVLPSTWFEMIAWAAGALKPKKGTICTDPTDGIIENRKRSNPGSDFNALRRIGETALAYKMNFTPHLSVAGVDENDLAAPARAISELRNDDGPADDSGCAGYWNRTQQGVASLIGEEAERGDEDG